MGSLLVELYAGTSGRLYDWNLGGSLEWYARSPGLNAVELNSSFYRIPSRLEAGVLGVRV
jgi:uncharacterized protein YecE (DUF72 family)